MERTPTLPEIRGEANNGLCPACAAEGVETAMVNVPGSPYATCPRVFGHIKLIPRFTAAELRHNRLARLPRATRLKHRHWKPREFSIEGQQGRWRLNPWNQSMDIEAALEYADGPRSRWFVLSEDS